MIGAITMPSRMIAPMRNPALIGLVKNTIGKIPNQRKAYLSLNINPPKVIGFGCDKPTNRFYRRDMDPLQMMSNQISSYRLFMDF